MRLGRPRRAALLDLPNGRPGLRDAVGSQFDTAANTRTSHSGNRANPTMAGGSAILAVGLERAPPPDQAAADLVAAVADADRRNAAPGVARRDGGAGDLVRRSRRLIEW